MAMDAYTKRFYCKTVTEGRDALTVDKNAGTDWCTVEMQGQGMITLRSKEHAESLVHMLNQMLGR